MKNDLYLNSSGSMRSNGNYYEGTPERIERQDIISTNYIAFKIEKMPIGLKLTYENNFRHSNEERIRTDPFDVRLDEFYRTRNNDSESYSGIVGFGLSKKFSLSFLYKNSIKKEIYDYHSNYVYSYSERKSSRLRIDNNNFYELTYTDADTTYSDTSQTYDNQSNGVWSGELNIPLGVSIKLKKWVSFLFSVNLNGSYHKYIYDDDSEKIWSIKGENNVAFEFYPYKNLEMAIYNLNDFSRYNDWKILVRYNF